MPFGYPMHLAVDRRIRSLHTVFGRLDSKCVLRSGNWIELGPGPNQEIFLLRRLSTERSLKIIPESGDDDRL